MEFVPDWMVVDFEDYDSAIPIPSWEYATELFARLRNTG
jgi:hypothetical protein